VEALKEAVVSYSTQVANLEKELRHKPDLSKALRVFLGSTDPVIIPPKTDPDAHTGLYLALAQFIKDTVQGRGQPFAVTADGHWFPVADKSGLPPPTRSSLPHVCVAMRETEYRHSHEPSAKRVQAVAH